MGTISIGILTEVAFNPGNDSSSTGAGTAIVGDSANVAVAANSGRSSLSISILDADAWIRLMPAATDPTVRKGFPIVAGETWILPTSWWRALYSGEVSIINAVDGQTPTYYVTEL